MPKMGVLTSELWLVVGAIVASETQVFSSNPDVNWGGAALAAVYAICRTTLKILTPPPATPTPSLVARVVAATGAGSSAQAPTAAPPVTAEASPAPTPPPPAVG